MMGEHDKSYSHGRRKKGLSGKVENQSMRFNDDKSNKGTIVRKQVDPETAKYFSEILNLLESTEIELEERYVICTSALEEARGKEFELATDCIISYTMQILIEGCDVDHLCSFLRSSANVFPCIAMDKSGSRVVETAFKALAKYAQDQEVYSVIEDTLNVICKNLIINPVPTMCNCHGSHVLRSLLCLCKGVAVDSPEFHETKTSTILAERLNFKESQLEGNDTLSTSRGFPHLLSFLVSGLTSVTRDDIHILQADRYSNLVLQTALKLLAGQDSALLKIIPILLCCNKQNTKEDNVIEISAVHNIIEMTKEAACSHLMEVILEVAPTSLYNEMFTKVFRNSLSDISLHQFGNFVSQALISHARSKDQMEVILEELGQKFRELLEMRKSGVIASIIAASQRLHALEHKCCHALATAIDATNESPSCIVPRLLYLESYFSCEDKTNWKWENGSKIHVMGSLILQAVFRYESEYIQPYVTSITCMQADNAVEAAKDSRGRHVIEAFLSSSASIKQKRRFMMKLRGHFGELSLHQGSSFTIEKCFTAGNMSLREAIISELLAVQNDLSKTKQGPYLLKKLDVDGFAYRPDLWRSKQASKESAYKEVYDMFASTKIKSSENDTFLASGFKQTSQPKDIKSMRKEIDDHISSAVPFLSKSRLKRPRANEGRAVENFTKRAAKDIPNKKGRSW